MNTDLAHRRALLTAALGLALLAGLVVEGGCAPLPRLEDVRATPAVSLGTFGGDHRAAAVCILDGLERGDVRLSFGIIGPGDTFRLLDRSPVSTEIVAQVVSSFFGPVGVFVLTLHRESTANGNEYGISLQSVRRGMVEDLRGIVERCAKDDPRKKGASHGDSPHRH
jgi:hypothetical protein